MRHRWPKTANTLGELSVREATQVGNGDYWHDQRVFIVTIYNNWWIRKEVWKVCVPLCVRQTKMWGDLRRRQKSLLNLEDITLNFGGWRGICGVLTRTPVYLLKTLDLVLSAWNHLCDADQSLQPPRSISLFEKCGSDASGLTVFPALMFCDSTVIMHFHRR